jgi:hypothetical protein
VVKVWLRLVRGSVVMNLTTKHQFDVPSQAQLNLGRLYAVEHVVELFKSNLVVVLETFIRKHSGSRC